MPNSKDHETGSYEVTLTVCLVERNRYGDEIGDGRLTYTKKSKATSLADLGAMLGRIEEALHA